MSRFCFPLSLVLAVFLFGASPALAQSFSDVPKEHNYFDAIEYVKSNSIVQGYSDGTFKPDNTINRAEFLKILIEAKIKNSDIILNCIEQPFSDVPVAEWYAAYACFAKQEGIIKGYSDGSFKPSQTITFAEAAKIVVNTMIEKTEEGSGEDWYKPFVQKLEDREIFADMQYCPTGNDFDPECAPDKLKLTRGNMAGIIYLLKNKKTSCYQNPINISSYAVVLAAGNYGGKSLDYQIDDSGHQSTQIDLIVNYTNSPVALILAAYEPNIWNISRTEKTNIEAIYINGYHRQVIAGIDVKNIPIIINTYQNRCNNSGYYISDNTLGWINPVSREVFGREVDKVYLHENEKSPLGEIIIGETPSAQEKIIIDGVSPESYYDLSVPLAGEAGLLDAIKKGILRKATTEDLKQLNDALKKCITTDIPPTNVNKEEIYYNGRAFGPYVVMSDFRYPAGLYGASSAMFIILEDISLPTGNPGHSTVYNLNNICGNY